MRPKSLILQPLCPQYTFAWLPTNYSEKTWSKSPHQVEVWPQENVQKKCCIRVSLFTKITTSKSNKIYQQHIMYWMNPKNCRLQSLPGRVLLNAQYLVPQHHSTAYRLLHEVWNMLMSLVDSTTFLDISREIRRIESVLSHCLCRRCSEIIKKKSFWFSSFVSCLSPVRVYFGCENLSYFPSLYHILHGQGFQFKIKVKQNETEGIH